ncbi:unnamed protein product [Pylaiella littoralis]
MYANASGWCIHAALLLAFPTFLSSAFIATSPRGAGEVSRHLPQLQLQQQQQQQQQQACTSTSRFSLVTREDGSSDSSSSSSSSSSGRSSRRELLEGGAVALLASVAAAALPAPSLAKGIDISEVKGLDVTEVMHLGAGSSGGKATKPLRDCLLNVERVRISTQQLEDTLTNEGAPPGLTSLIKGLIKNYKLDDSLQQGAKYIESPGDRNAAASAGREALEYLALTAEYFPVVVDDRTGAPKKLSSEALEFTINALIATRAKLDLFLSKVPSDALREARAEIKSEGTSES